MNIIVVSHGASGGGSERVASILANYLVQKHNVHFYAIHSPEKEYYLDERLKYFYGGTCGNNKIVNYIERTNCLRKYIKDNDIDVMISFIYSEGFAVYRNKKIKKIFSLRNDPNQESKVDLWAIKKLYKDADAVIFQTNDAMNYFDKTISRHGVVIPNPIKSNLPEWDRVGHNKEVLAAGRLHSQKNFPMLIRAFATFSKLHADYILTICGEGKLMDSLKTLAKECEIEQKVFFPGHVRNVHERMQNAAIYVSSSDYEGISNSMLEALAIGIPSVCTDCPIGGARMFIKDNVNGFLVPIKDDTALANKLALVADNMEMMEKISTEAQKIRGELDENTICQKWEKIMLDC